MFSLLLAGACCIVCMHGVGKGSQNAAMPTEPDVGVVVAPVVVGATAVVVAVAEGNGRGGGLTCGQVDVVAVATSATVVGNVVDAVVVAVAFSTGVVVAIVVVVVVVEGRCVGWQIYCAEGRHTHGTTRDM